MTSTASGSRLPSTQSASPVPAESREETLRRQLAERRRARETAALPQRPPAPSAVAGSSSTGGLSIKGKGKAAPLSERLGGMRGWDEVPAVQDDAAVILPRAEASASPVRAGSEESSLAYPRSPSPANGRSRSPRRRRDDSPPRRDRSNGDTRRQSDRSPEPRGRDRSTSIAYRRSPPPVRKTRDDRSPPRASSHYPPRRDSPPPQRQRSPTLLNPTQALPRRTFDNPDRLAMRQDGGRQLPPHPDQRNQRYDPRRNTGGPIQAEPMRGPGQGERRPSPTYNAYERPPHMASGTGPGVAGGSGANAYGYGPGRGDLAAAPPLGQQGGWQNPPRRNNGPVNFEERRLQREKSTLIAWPASPKEPYRDDAEIEADRRAARKASKSKPKSKKTKHRSRYSSASSSDSEDSEVDRRVKRRKSDKRGRYASSDSDSDDDGVDKRRKRRQSVESDSEDEEAERRRRKRKSKSKSKSRARSVVGDEEEAWLEKDGAGRGSEAPLSLEDLAKLQKKRKEDEEEIGPILPGDTVRLQQRQRYEDMRPEEAEAMAIYASNGMRIPRRGEIGIDTERIQTLEGSGYVMSGARNKKMNAMRLRKENQVINAEEKRAILNLQREEKIKKEGMIVSQFRELMNTSIQRQT